MLLGITINNKLNWNSHMNKVTKKIPKTVGILNKLRPLQVLPSALQLQLISSISFDGAASSREMAGIT